MSRGKKKNKDEVVTRVEKHNINSNHELYKFCDDICFKTKNLYNYGNYQVRQGFILGSKLEKEAELSGEEYLRFVELNTKITTVNDLKNRNIKLISKEHKFIGYQDLDKIIQKDFDYKELLAQISQQTLRQLEQDWKSFFASIKDWKKNPSKYTGKPNLPKYKKKNGRTVAIITSSIRIEDNELIFPKSLKLPNLKTNITGTLKQVRIVPKGNIYTIDIVYDIPKVELYPDIKRVVGIDLGLNNFATLTNNLGYQPMIINGKPLKSINQYYNKKKAFLTSELMKSQGTNWSKKLSKLTLRRNNLVSDYIHKSSRIVINYALSINADTIVIGNNKHWKKEINIGKKNNQNFVSIPFSIFIEQIKYKANAVGIKVVVTEEGYTSKCSFLDLEDVCKQVDYLGKRVKRGLFISSKGVLINADVNGSYNIIRKVVPTSSLQGIEGFGLNPFKINVV